MQVTFVSNYINHHQVPFCNAMYKELGEAYHFIQTQPMEEERIRMGWGENLEELPYLLLYYEEEEACRRLIAKSDVVLFGGVEDEGYIADRLKAGRLTVRLSERIYKEGQWKAISPRGLIKKYRDHTRYRKKNVYLLCCGGYVASDFHIVRAYPDKMFQWGYFPRLQRYDIEELLEKKRRRREAEGRLSLLWAGRFIDWKHPEHAIEAAARLKREGYDFSLTMVGGGEMEEKLKEMAAANLVSDKVVFAGFQKPDEVRRRMEQADIFLFTSDYREGWGAVLNEAMNSGCAVVANCAIGAVPFLLKPNQNGLVYPNRRTDIFYDGIVQLIKEPEKTAALGREAYRTISGEWNAERAVEKLLPMLEGLLAGRAAFAPEGILSRAQAVAQRKMYGYLTAGKRREDCTFGRQRGNEADDEA